MKALSTPGMAYDELPCAWLQLDERGLITDLNRALVTLVGLSREALMGRPFDALLSGPSRMLYQSYLQPLLRMHGNVEEIGLTLRRPGDGNTVDVLFYSARMMAPQPDGQAPTATDPSRTQVLLAQINRRRDIEAQMLRIKRAADQSPGLIFQLMQLPDGRQHFPYVSEAVRELYGVTAEDARDSAQALFAQVEPDDLQRMSQGMAAAAAAGQHWTGSFRVRRGAAGQRWHEMHGTPRALANGVIVWHGHIADVTEHRQLERALAERQAADQLNRMRSDFLARVSHELRTPLNGIVGFAQLLARDAPDNLTAVQRDRLDVLTLSSQHLLQLVNQLMDMASIDALQSAFEVSPVALEVSLQEALHLVRALADERGVQLRPPLLGSAQVLVMANPLRLRQVFVNLLGNAIKYNRPGGHVALQVDCVDDIVRVAVADSGIGLTAAQIEALFQPFNRLGAEHSSTEGSGLGLVITRHLLSLMGGSLSVDSEAGVGSTFTMQLSRVPGDATFASATPSIASRACLAPAACGELLYVEDNLVNVLLMEAIVGLRPRCRLRVASSGAEALDLLRQPGWRPDLILLDMQLPDVSGEALLQQIRQQPGLRAVPALVVSASSQGDDVRAALAAGFADHWMKPLDVDDTLAQLDRWLAPDRTYSGLAPH